MALLVFQDQPHDQGDNRVSAGFSHERILRECVLLGARVPLHCFQERPERAGVGPWFDFSSTGKRYRPSMSGLFSASASDMPYLP